MLNSRYTQTSCPNCNSSDAYTIYEDGGYCFSCGYTNKKEKVNEMDRPTNSIQPVVGNESRLLEISSYSSYNIGSRNLSKDTIEHFKIKLDPATKSHFYPYTRNGKIVAYKERKQPKSFSIHGSFTDVELFGQAQATNGKSLIITEGELDACAVAESIYKHYKKYFPVVSIPSATGLTALLKQRDWVRSFESVVLMFDNDEAGEKAIEQAAKIIGIGKVKIAKLKEKDPCDELIKAWLQSCTRSVLACKTMVSSWYPN